MSEQAANEVIATAMLLGAAFSYERGTAGLSRLFWYASSPDTHTGGYFKKYDAAIAFLRKRGVDLDINGEPILTTKP